MPATEEKGPEHNHSQKKTSVKGLGLMFHKQDGWTWEKIRIVSLAEENSSGMLV